MKRTTYTIIELKELIGGEAYKKALDWLYGETGIKDEEDLIIEAEEFQLTFYRNGNPAKN